MMFEGVLERQHVLWLTALGLYVNVHPPIKEKGSG